MNKINLLEQDTIDKIAAGEVIERPASIVKELVENAIDAGSNAVTVEIKEGGISFIRITDNGEGIPKDQISTAFLRHATSKIHRVEDLLQIGSLGFRGEALSSIAAVCQVELISKTAGSLTGVRYLIEGGREKGMEEIGAPEGSTFLVRNIFFNTPARKKFLKSAATEAGYISDLMERMALSRPEISFKFINNGQTKLHTSGNGNQMDIIYSIYGRDIASNLVKIDQDVQGIKMTGFIGKPVISRGNRNYENYFINGRYVRSNIIARGIEEGYKTFMMQHRYPFTVLCFEMDGNLLDINVHPTKMELRFADNAQMYQLVCETVRDSLAHRDLILKTSVSSQKEEKKLEKENGKKAPEESAPEPFEKIRRELLAESKSPYQSRYPRVYPEQKPDVPVKEKKWDNSDDA
ncbi:MAG: DNA mismatch repair endonuclease MutL, partial [Lachnospiraceae bacterium]|nr:DNA mismatch repair endonuclease MutL [Lachnospiraceae bacterium]